jgi:outer membrane receptor protein involved in Fe transport
MIRQDARSGLMSAASALILSVTAPMALPGAALAQQSAAPAQQVQEVVVTGTRLKSGFASPTPLTATSAETLERPTPGNIVDALNQLPDFAATNKSETPLTAATGGQNGQNLLNLRDLGFNRNLVLLDGRRIVPTNSAGGVDNNIIPQALVKRVDVVTGGASAAYGSDAVSGVINYILDTRFTGVQANLGAGVSTYGDLPSGHVSLTGGAQWLDGRFRLIGSAEGFTEQGVGAGKVAHRRWFDDPAGLIPNPTPGASPNYLVVPSMRSNLATYGGLIDNGPLQGTMFLPGGATAPCTYGSGINAARTSTFASGGCGAIPTIAFAPDQKRAVFFAHGEFDVSPALTLYGEGHFAYANVLAHDFIDPQQGGSNQFTIFSGNAFLPPSVQGLMTQDRIASFTLGRYEADFPTVDIDQTTNVYRGVLGAFGTLPHGWTWDASYTHGETHQEVSERNLVYMNHLYAAVDAVVRPVTGQIVCNAVLTGDNPGCAPLNLFGVGAPSAAAISYVTGASTEWLNMQQDVVQLSFNGDLGSKLNLGAGPISVALGAESRREGIVQTSDSLSQATTTFPGVRGFPAARNNQQGSFNFFNPLPLSGSYTVTEGFAELGVPLLRDHFLTKALNTELAVRQTQYSLQGGATTWKYNLTDQATDDVMLRFTQSRDIRAPDVLELFNTATQNSNNVVYNGATVPALQISQGSRTLTPEIARTTTGGFVLTPTKIQGLRLSLDYFGIDIGNAITALTPQQIIQECQLGDQAFCQDIVQNNGSLIIYTRSINVNAIKEAGYDLDATYATPLPVGRLSTHLLLNHLTTYNTHLPGVAPIRVLDTAPAPTWKGLFSLDYTANRWDLSLQQRYISGTLMNPNILPGVSTQNTNKVPEVWYTDLTLTYNIHGFAHDEEIYATVDNLFNRSPPIDVVNPTSFSSPTNAIYDRDGRYFNLGIKVRY